MKPVVFDLRFDVEGGHLRMTCMGRELLHVPSETLTNYPEDFGRAVSAVVRAEVARQGIASPYRNGGTL